MTELHIDIRPEHPDTADRDALLAALDADNEKTSGGREGSDFAVILRAGPDGRCIGGLWGVDDYGWAFVSYLLVPAEHRGDGLGRRLMAEAEAIAHARGMAGVWLNTFDFQAREFYEKLGYDVFAELPASGRARGQYFLRKVF
ncbi:GNAT family N-acetyltransferase [Rhizobium sp. TRM95111]|uniref:GNAT family N-acetyltransferase n=1 Tax=Rhizobium alarense TaxID=2846851 RepID=UPI001F42402F|nr:GNAT family N-acetyltransferase [Rhizobium alarense]MCF3639096.1 GNAT family N-acetyltransferase [Rhizobium alarense]